MLAPEGQEYCAACIEKKRYHKEVNEVVEEPKAVRISTEFFMRAVDDCPEKLTRDHAVLSEQTDLIKEGSMDTIDYALRFLIKSTLERDGAQAALVLTKEELFREYEAYMERFEKCEKDGVKGLNSFTAKLGGKTIVGMTKDRTRHHGGRTFANPIAIYILDLQAMATNMKVDVVVPNEPIKEALRQPDPPRNRKLPETWAYRFEQTEEWVRTWVETFMADHEEDEEEAADDLPASMDDEHTREEVVERLPTTSGSNELVQAQDPTDIGDPKKKRKLTGGEANGAGNCKRTAIDPATGVRECGCGPWGGCPDCA